MVDQAARAIAIMVSKELSETTERVRTIKRISEYNRGIIGGEFDCMTHDLLDVAERCLEDVRREVQRFLDGQIIALRSARGALDANCAIDDIEHHQYPPRSVG
jgi:hypothetical protein